MNGPTIIISVIYNDAPAGLRWLTEVLGLRQKSLYQMPDGHVAFAELVWRSGMMFVSSRPPADNPWSRVGIASIDEGTFTDGNWVPGRRLNGDEDDQGQYWRFDGRSIHTEKLKLYRYP